MPPLMLAAYYNHPLLVRELIKHGANIEVTTPVLGCTSLMLASKNGHIDVITELLAAGANYQKIDKNGKTALELAKTQCVIDTILDFQNRSGNKIDVNESSILEVTACDDCLYEKKCVVCLKPKREKSFFMNCGHITACLKCAQDIFSNSVKKQCPTCKAKIQSVHRAYDC